MLGVGHFLMMEDSTGISTVLTGVVDGFIRKG